MDMTEGHGSHLPMIPPTLLSTPRPAQDSLSDLDQPGDAGGHDEECFTSALGNMPDLQVKVATARHLPGSVHDRAHSDSGSCRSMNTGRNSPHSAVDAG
jgi:hypothetical protein